MVIEWKKKCFYWRKMICCLQETKFWKQNTYRIRVKGFKKIFNVRAN